MKRRELLGVPSFLIKTSERPYFPVNSSDTINNLDILRPLQQPYNLVVG